MASPTGVIRRQTVALGRSGPRSKSGCQTCRTRRVRCDEKRPICSHCDRLKLECAYRSPQQRQRRQRRQTNPGGASASPVSTTSSGRERAVQEDECIAVNNNSEMSYGELSVGNEEMTSGNSSIPQVLAKSPEDTVSIQVARQANNQFAFDNTSCAPTAGSSFNGASSIFVDFGQAHQEKPRPWGPTTFNDYLPLPDPAFPFTSLGFTNTLDLFDSEQANGVPLVGIVNNAQSWPSDISDMPIFPSNSSALSALHSGGDDDLTAPAETSQRRRTSSRPAFAVSPPLLSPAQEEMLRVFFERDIRPPASIVGVDPLGWLKIKRYVLRVAKDDNEYVMHALFALSTLLSASSMPIRFGINQGDHKLFASRLQEAACAAIETGLAHEGWESSSSHALLVSVFLLAWFETAFDENEDRPSFPRNLAEQVIVRGRDWNPGSAHLFQWLTLLDSKVSHLGGRHLLSEPALQVVRQSRPGLTTQADVENDEDPDTDAAQVRGSVDMQSSPSKVLTPPTKSMPANRLGYLLSSGMPTSLPPSVIKMDIFNILLQPAFEFHMASQAYSRRIGCHDRHHRTRGTPEDELEVMNVCMGFEVELQELWRRRPGILNLDASQFREFVSEGIARRLEQLFSVYIATFWTHFIYIQRVAYWSLKHTPITLKAIEQAGNMVRRSVGQPIDQHAFDKSLPRTPGNSIHPGLMWTVFMFGCEVADPIQQEWCVLQLRALGNLPSTGADGTSGDGSDELLAFRLDEKGAQNALKASRLLEQLIKRQSRAGGRMDGKYLSQELFGCHFYII